MKHTPGPWITDDRHIHPAHGLAYPPGVEPETDVIVLVDTDGHRHALLNETDKANLRLIAAAPEMLAALQECVAWHRLDAHRTHASTQVGSRMLLSAAAAIAKATAA